MSRDDAWRRASLLTEMLAFAGLINALRRGVGIHHSGMARVSSLFLCISPHVARETDVSFSTFSATVCS